MSKVTVSFEVDDEMLWSSVMGSGFEMWSWWSKFRFVDGADWDKPGKVILGIDDPATPESDPSEISKTLTVRDLAVAYGRCLEQGYNLDQTIDTWDASEGDLVLQMAMLGEVTYA